MLRISGEVWGLKGVEPLVRFAGHLEAYSPNLLCINFVFQNALSLIEMHVHDCN